MQKLVKFVVIGGAATLLQFFLLAGFVQFELLPATAASAASYAISAIFNYLANYHFTFASTRSHQETLPKFIVTAGVGVALNTGLFALSLASLKYLIASTPWLSAIFDQFVVLISTNSLTIISLMSQVFATMLTLIVNFLMHKFWIYRR